MLMPLLASMILTQTIPTSASVIYPCFPESKADTTVRMMTHAATYKLAKDSVEFSSLSVLKNDSDQPATVDLILPVRGKQVNWEQSQKMRFAATLNKVNTKLQVGEIVRTPPNAAQKANGIWAATFQRSYTTRITFKPHETKSLATNFSAPIGRAGLDGVQKMVVYDTAGADNWGGAIGQFNYAIQYRPSLVLNVYAALPEGNWQIGSSGAFWKKYDYAPPQKATLIFTYYPGGFEKIGGGR